MYRPEGELQRTFDAVLCNGAEGIAVFTRILMDLGLFDEIETEQERVRHNYALQLLYNVGAISPTRRAQVIKNFLPQRKTKRAIKRMLKNKVPA